MTGAKLTPGGVRAVGWGLAYLALAGVIGMELDWGRSIHPLLPVPKPAAAARADYPIQPEYTLLSLEQGFAETTARPMFTPGRLPPPPPAPPKPAMQKGQFVLLGTLITKEKSVALLRDAATGKATRVEQGKEIRGITVTNVLPEKVNLMQYDDSEELVLKIQSAPKPFNAPNAAPPIQPNQTQPAPQQAASAASSDKRAIINARRAAQGMPPI